MLLQLALGANTLSVSTDVLVGSSPLDLAISGAPGRVPAGGAITYTLGFGNEGSVAVPATLSVPVPAGTTFVSATGSGTQSGGAVQWDLACKRSKAVGDGKESTDRPFGASFPIACRSRRNREPS